MIYVMGNTFGSLFKISTWGESHGGGVGVVIDGCPSLLSLKEDDIQRDLDRRRPGQSKITTQRAESDTAEILSGVFEGKTLGTPIAILVRNEDAKPAAYDHLKDAYRPSHADFTYDAKYGIRNWQGGGRSSARETIGRVAAGAVARALLNESTNMEVLAWVSQIHDIKADVQSQTVSIEDIEAEITRCPDREASETMISAITEARKNGDSLGGIVTCLVRGVPAGLGVPVFDRIEADLAKAMLSLPASKGFDILYLFLLADLFCCAFVYTVFYSFYNKGVNERTAYFSIIIGLIGGFLLFPFPDFSKSLLVGILMPKELFSPFILQSLLFLSFIVATFLPAIILKIKKN